MNLEESVRSVLNRYAAFDGRAGRSEFWFWILFVVAVSMAINIASMMLGILTIVGWIFQLAIIIPSIAVGIRRMHDVGKSGWFVLIPVYNLYLYTLPSEGPNAYGTAPAGALKAV